jgi:hypothetical protein
LDIFALPFSSIDNSRTSGISSAQRGALNRFVWYFSIHYTHSIYGQRVKQPTHYVKGWRWGRDAIGCGFLILERFGGEGGVKYDKEFDFY